MKAWTEKRLIALAVMLADESEDRLCAAVIRDRENLKNLLADEGRDHPAAWCHWDNLGMGKATTKLWPSKLVAEWERLRDRIGSKRRR